MPAVANAVYDAIGVRIDEVPITPEKIVKALQAKASGRTSRYGPARFPEIKWPDPLIVPPPWEGGDGNAVNDPRARRDRRTDEAAAQVTGGGVAQTGASGGGAPRATKKC